MNLTIGQLKTLAHAIDGPLHAQVRVKRGYAANGVSPNRRVHVDLGNRRLVLDSKGRIIGPHELSS